MTYCLATSVGYGLIIWVIILAIFFAVIVFIVVKLIRIICEKIAENKENKRNFD